MIKVSLATGESPAAPAQHAQPCSLLFMYWFNLPPACQQRPCTSKLGSVIGVHEQLSVIEACSVHACNGLSCCSSVLKSGRYNYLCWQVVGINTCVHHQNPLPIVTTAFASMNHVDSSMFSGSGAGSVARGAASLPFKLPS
jgi:hypothetical protein